MTILWRRVIHSLFKDLGILIDFLYLTIVCRPDLLWRGMRCQLGTVALASDTSWCLFDADCTVNITLFTDCKCRCVIVRGNKVISKGHNQTNMTKNVRFLVPTFSILHAVKMQKVWHHNNCTYRTPNLWQERNNMQRQT
jgi:hypothetical protein